MANTSFSPLGSGYLNNSLLGVADPVKFTDPLRPENTELLARHVHDRTDTGSKQEMIKYTILIIVISAIIFVTVVASYDVIKTIIANYYARAALINPKSHNKQNDINRTIIANQNSLISASVFALICIASTIIATPIIISNLFKSQK